MGLFVLVFLFNKRYEPNEKWTNSSVKKNWYLIISFLHAVHSNWIMRHMIVQNYTFIWKRCSVLFYIANSICILCDMIVLYCWYTLKSFPSFMLFLHLGRILGICSHWSFSLRHTLYDAFMLFFSFRRINIIIISLI